MECGAHTAEFILLQVHSFLLSVVLDLHLLCLPLHWPQPHLPTHFHSGENLWGVKAVSCVSNVRIWKCTPHRSFLTCALDTVFLVPTHGPSCASDFACTAVFRCIKDGQ